MTKAERAEASALIDFWFGRPDSPERFKPREIWFKTDPDFDEALRLRFQPLQQRAAQGACAEWMHEAEPCLALVLLLDQLPRNLYRGLPQAFASDALAREVARAALAQGFDLSLPVICRQFICLPFEHSEDLADQEKSVALFEALARDPIMAKGDDYARRHYAIIARFGRFPHRNHILGRVSSAEEEEFLKGPNSSF